MQEIIVTAKCRKNGKYILIKFEKQESRWNATDSWKGATSEISQKRVDTDKKTIEAVIGVSHTYPGCPYCEDTQIFRCSTCENMYCYDGESSEVYCVTCDINVILEGEISVIEGNDRSTGAHNATELGQKSDEIGLK